MSPRDIAGEDRASALAICAHELLLPPDVARTLVSAAPTLMSAPRCRTCFRFQLSAARPAGGYFSGFCPQALQRRRPRKFVAHRRRRPERPPAGRIACHTKGQSRVAGEARAIMRTCPSPPISAMADFSIPAPLGLADCRASSNGSSLPAPNRRRNAFRSSPPSRPLPSIRPRCWSRW